MFQQPSPTSITRCRQGLQTSFSEYGCSSAPVLPTQRLTRPNRGRFFLASGGRCSLCQRHRNSGIGQMRISSLCPSASWPPKVGPGFRPELRLAYSRTRCLPCRKAGNLHPDTMQTAYLSSARKGTKMVLSTRLSYGGTIWLSESISATTASRSGRPRRAPARTAGLTWRKTRRNSRWPCGPGRC